MSTATVPPATTTISSIEDANKARNENCDRWLLKNFRNTYYWKHYRPKHDYTRMSIQEVAELATDTRKDLTHLIVEVGFGAQFITTDEIEWYYREKRTGYKLGAVPIIE